MTSSYGRDCFTDKTTCEEKYDLFDVTFDEIYASYIEKDAPEYETQIEVDYDP
jgi:hypothetical protein|tara:strand:- start:300 stop:458 length:159 start_codon:yes stop_codon:yes gene_type:complete